MSAPSTALAQQGHHIYAYCNVRTQQVLYSLTRSLEPDALKQLPDAGANNKPPQLRKDTWRPLFTVALPSTDAGALQARHALKLLRQWRLLHETSWTPPKELSQPYTEAQIKELEEKREQRGGKKKETIYDYIKRQKKKIRAKMVMNQKGHSIADLAKVLFQQCELAQADEARQRELIVRLAEENARNRTLPKLRAEIAGVEASIAAMPEKLTRAEETTQLRAKEKLYHMKLELKRMAYAVSVVNKAQAQWRKENGVTGKKEAAEVPVAKSADRSPLSTDGTLTAPTVDPETTPSYSHLQDRLPLFPPRQARSNADLLLPIRRSKILTELSESDHHSFSADGVKVFWADPMDAEHAEAWPAEVQHVNMALGLRRHTAAKPIEVEPPELQEGETAYDVRPDTHEPRESRAEHRRRRLRAREAKIAEEVRRRWQSYGDARRAAPGALDKLRQDVRAQLGGGLRRLRQPDLSRIRAQFAAMKLLETKTDATAGSATEAEREAREAALVEAGDLQRLTELRTLRSQILSPAQRRPRARALAPPASETERGGAGMEGRV